MARRDASKLLPVALLRELLTYDPDTGVLIWRKRTLAHCVDARSMNAFNATFAGKPAFTAKVRGYSVGAIKGVPVKASRVAWAMHHGSWPENDVDHEDRDRANNRIKNLRDIPNAVNAKNRSLRSDNKSGVNGVHRERKRWRANVSVDGKIKTLGRFDTIEEATAARTAALSELGFHPNHGNRRG